MAQDNGTLAVGTIGGTDFLATFERASLQLSGDRQDYSSPVRGAPRRSTVKLGMTFEVDLLAIAGAVPVDHTYLSALSLGAVDILDLLEGLSFSGSYERREEHGAGKLWKRPYNTGRDFRATVEVGAAATGDPVWPVAMASASEADRKKVLSMTLNSATITLPMIMASCSVAYERYGLQVYNIELEGDAPASPTAYPTAPTGTVALIDKAMNAYNTALAFVWNSHATDGFDATGNIKFSGFSFEIRDGMLVPTKYQFESYGTVTVANSA